MTTDQRTTTAALLFGAFALVGGGLYFENMDSGEPAAVQELKAATAAMQEAQRARNLRYCATNWDTLAMQRSCMASFDK